MSKKNFALGILVCIGGIVLAVSMVFIVIPQLKETGWEMGNNVYYDYIVNDGMPNYEEVQGQIELMVVESITSAAEWNPLIAESWERTQEIAEEAHTAAVDAMDGNWLRNVLP